MMPANTTLSTVDFSRLMPLVAASAARVTNAVVEQLDQKLVSATVVAPETMHPDIVTMNSKVVLACPAWDGPREYRLVYPSNRPCEPGELSVLSVLGAQLLGARIGERFALGEGPSFRVVELVSVNYQPEAAGDWDL